MYNNKDDWNFYSTYNVPGVIPHTLQILTNLIITATLHGRYYYYPNIIDKESEIINGLVILLRPQNQASTGILVLESMLLTILLSHLYVKRDVYILLETWGHILHTILDLAFSVNIISCAFFHVLIYSLKYFFNGCMDIFYTALSLFLFLKNNYKKLCNECPCI